MTFEGYRDGIVRGDGGTATVCPCGENCQCSPCTCGGNSCEGWGG